MKTEKQETSAPVRKAGRPKLSKEQIAERDAKKKEGGENRDSVRIYFTPLQYARLKDYHAQGGVQPGEAIRLAVDAYFKELMVSGEYEPIPAAMPKSVRVIMEARQKAEREYKAIIERETGGDPSVDVSDDFPPPAGLKGKSTIR